MDSSAAQDQVPAVHLIFDLDGTLVDSLPGIATALNRALTSLDLPVHHDEEILHFIGHGSLELARRALTKTKQESKASAVEAAFQRDYERAWKTGTTLYPGVATFIQKFHQQGHHLAVLSNKPHDFTCRIVDHFFPAAPFEFVLGQSERFPKKPAPDAAHFLLREWSIPASEAVFIGDSAVDRETAENAGIPFQGVSWGYHKNLPLGPLVSETMVDLDVAIHR